MRVQVPGPPMAIADDRRAGVAQQFQHREHVGGRLRGAHQLDHGAAVAQVAVRAEQVGRHPSNQCWDAMTCVGEPPPQPATRSRRSASTSM